MYSIKIARLKNGEFFWFMCLTDILLEEKTFFLQNIFSSMLTNTDSSFLDSCELLIPFRIEEKVKDIFDLIFEKINPKKGFVFFLDSSFVSLQEIIIKARGVKKGEVKPRFVNEVSEPLRDGGVFIKETKKNLYLGIPVFELDFSLERKEDTKLGMLFCLEKNQNNIWLSDIRFLNLVKIWSSLVLTSAVSNNSKIDIDTIDFLFDFSELI